MDRKKNRKRARGRGRWILLAVFLVILSTILVNVYENQTIIVKEYEIASKRLPDEFVGYRILQLTDLHSIGDEMAQKTIEKVKNEAPDLIVITGDLIDSTVYNREKSEYLSGKRSEIPGQNMLSLLEEIVDVAPIYYVYGNHEMMLLDDPDSNSFKVAVEAMGIEILNVGAVTLTKGEASIQLMGIQDPATVYKNPKYAYLENSQTRVRAMIEDAMEGLDSQQFTVLLSHRPELFEVYQEYAIDLAITGHAHGGQIRIPFVGGVYAPSQGFWPGYDKGLYKADRLEMVVGVGIGNSKFPVRVFNTPEIVVIELKSER